MLCLDILWDDELSAYIKHKLMTFILKLYTHSMACEKMNLGAYARKAWQSGELEASGPKHAVMGSGI